MRFVLLTGGSGYIGSHTYLALHAAGLTPVILDNFSNSSPVVLYSLQRLKGQLVLGECGSVADTSLVQTLIERYKLTAVIHFAGFKAVAKAWRSR